MIPRAPAQARTKTPFLDPSAVRQLLDLRDAVGEAKCLITAAWLACGSPMLDRSMASALSAVTNVAGTRLGDILVTLDGLIAIWNTRDG